MTFVSHSQNFEDVMLWRALGHVQNGSYIDVGAQDPFLHSVSLAFYERGWRGLHVEPTLQYSDKLRNARPDELVLQVALGREEGILSFFEFADTGLSTSNSEIAAEHRSKGFNSKKTSVPVMTLDTVLQSQGDREVHWLKVDVEGAEKNVLEGWKTAPVRPWIVVIEATLPMSTTETHQEWEHLIFRKGYTFAYFDGLNRFYVSNEHGELIEKFRSPPNVFDQYALVADHHLCRLAINETHKAQQEVARSTELVRRYSQSTRRLEAQLTESHERVRRLEADLARLNNDLQAAHRTCQELARSVTAIRTSASWRVTSPIRWVSIQIRLLLIHGLRQRFKMAINKLRGLQPIPTDQNHDGAITAEHRTSPENHVDPTPRTRQIHQILINAKNRE
ncbi:FkbM family methyltransferase [Hydrogenophaga luteola]|uniref:FkbM family methyltransferase n=1 Tax=Hydrogenophaga luteola TaxID=1591122 RepID=A0ABV7W6Z8_9BURK